MVAPFQLLEINVISAQDLQPVCRKMKTYAVAWVHADRKLTTRVDSHGHTNPTWNDKFVFRVDDEFLYGETSAVMIEIYALHWFRKIHVGSVRVLIGNLVPHLMQPQNRNQVQLGMRFVALQAWRPSGRPQGILNLGVALLDSSMRSMPLYMQLGSSAVGYRHLMGEDDRNDKNPQMSHNGYINIQERVQLRRTKSDSSSLVAPMSPRGGMSPRGKGRAGSIVNGSVVNGSIVNSTGLNGSIVNGSVGKKKGGSMVNVEIGKKSKKGGSMINGQEVEEPKIKEGKNGSMVNGSIVNASDFVDPPKRGKGWKKKGSIINGQLDDSPLNPVENPLAKINGQDFGYGSNPFSKFGGFEYGNQKVGRFITDSELGPSPSEVAAAVARNFYTNPRQDDGHSAVGGWSLVGSEEGLQSKLDRWREELPPLYDRGESSSYQSSAPSSARSRQRPRRRNSDGGGGFTCFGNICGCEVSIQCGGGGPPAPRKTGNSRHHRRSRTSSFENMSFI